MTRTGRFADERPAAGSGGGNLGDLTELGRDHMDVVAFRHSGRGSVTDHVAALAALRDEGLLRHIGLSNVTLPQLEESLQVSDIVCVQSRHAAGYERGDTGDPAHLEQNVAAAGLRLTDDELARMAELP